MLDTVAVQRFPAQNPSYHFRQNAGRCARSQGWSRCRWHTPASRSIPPSYCPGPHLLRSSSFPRDEPGGTTWDNRLNVCLPGSSWQFLSLISKKVGCFRWKTSFLINFQHLSRNSAVSTAWKYVIVSLYIILQNRIDKNMKPPTLVCSSDRPLGWHI